MSNSDELAHLLGFDEKDNTPSVGYAKVVSTGQDTQDVLYKGSTVPAASFCEAEPGDVVCVLNNNGSLVSVANKRKTEKTYIYEATPNLLTGATWKQGSNSTASSTNRITCERVIPLTAGKKYTVASTNSDSFWPVYLSICQADGTHIENTPTNAHPLLEYTPTANCYVRVVYGTSTVGNLTPADVATFKPVMVEGNTSWTVKRTGDHVELDGAFYGMQAKSSSTTNHSDYPEFPVAFDAGRTEDGGPIAQVTRCRYQVSNAAVMRDGAERTKMKIYTTIAAVSADFTYETYLHVAGKSTSDIPLRTASTTSGNWVLSIGGLYTTISHSGTKMEGALIRLYDPSTGVKLKAGTYEIGIDCDESECEKEVVQITDPQYGKYNRHFGISARPASAPNNGIDKYIAQAEVNGLPIDQRINDWFGHRNERFTLEEDAAVILYAYAAASGTKDYTYKFTPWIRRIS